MSPPILLDISRLVSRASRPVPTGIDRIELAYAEHLLARAGDALTFVAMNDAGEVAPVRRRYARLLIDTLAECWRAADEGGRAARRAGLLTRVSGLVPRQPLPSAQDGGRPVYLLVSHQNLHHPRRLERFRARSGAAFVFFVHDLVPIEYPEYVRPGHAERHRDRIRTVCALADGVIVNSAATSRALAPHLARTGRDIPVLVAPPGAEFTRSQLGPQHEPRSPGSPTFICLGTIEPRKNHLLLLHVWRQLATVGQPPRLVLIGQRGWENENVVDIIERCTALEGVVEEHNTLADRELGPRLAGACALLSPSFAEGYGMPVAEALALGTPVICSDIEAHREAGGAAAEFLSPLDGLGWMEAVRDYAQPHSPRRAAQLARIDTWQAPTWTGHMDAVQDFLLDVSIRPVAAR